MAAEHGSSIGNQDTGIEVFYPGPDQIGFGVLGVLADKDLDAFAVPKEPPPVVLDDHTHPDTSEIVLADFAPHPNGHHPTVDLGTTVTYESGTVYTNGHKPQEDLDRTVPVDTGDTSWDEDNSNSEKEKREKKDKKRKERKFHIENDGDYFGTTVPFGSINVLKQPRQTFVDIEGLADSIASEGLIQPPIVVRFDRANAAAYLKTLNNVWGTEYTVDDLVFTEDEERNVSATVLIAGERRFRACKHLQTHGCSECRSQVEPEEDGTPGKNPKCWETHFEKDILEVRMGINVSPRSALNRQSAENMHRRVPPHQDAVFLNNYWKFVKSEDPSYPLAAFSRDVGRSEGTIRDAVKYSNLPIIVREAVERNEGSIPYGVAIEIHKLLQMKDPTTIQVIDGPAEFLDWIDLDRNGKTVTGRYFEMSDENLGDWVNKYLSGNYKIPDFRELVTNFINEREAGQRNMFDIMMEGQGYVFEAGQRKLVVERNSVRALYGLIRYLKIVNDLQKRGKLGLEDSPFSSGSPARLMLELASLLDEVLPNAGGMSRKKKEKALESAAKAIAVYSEIVGEDRGGDLLG